MALVAAVRRVGVLGAQRAGKSTFLTALISHLRAHHPGEFPIGDGSVRVTFGGLLPNTDGTPPFPYADFRGQLADRRWPGKTTAVSEYRCRLGFAGGSWYQRLAAAVADTELSLVDLPGERLADLGMAGVGYEAWCDALLGLFEAKYDYLQESRGYLALVEGGGPLTAPQVVHEYKLALARLAFKDMPVVTPSTLVVSPAGEYVPRAVRRSRDAAALAAAHHVGLDADRQFAPLPADARAAHPDLTSRFASHYTAYRDQVVGRLVDKFYACDTLLVLIDPTALLAGGVGVYNGCLHMLDVALKALAPAESAGAWAADAAVRFLTAGLTGLPGASALRKVGFVVSQADKAHAADRDKLGRLVRDLTGPLVEQAVAARRLTVGHFVTAAVDSSASTDYPHLEVLPLDERDRPEAAARRVRVSPVPDRWPKTWAAGDFFYPRFAPVTPPRADHPPAHVGLHRVAEFVFDY